MPVDCIGTELNMNRLTSEQQAILTLLQQSLWGESFPLPTTVNWEAVDVVAKEQGVISFMYDGAIKAGVEVPPEILQNWKKKMLHGVVNNERLLIAQNELFSWFTQEKIPAVVLKGSSVARCYPKPELRVLGDIDILVSKEDLTKAQNLLESKGYKTHESDHGFHVGLCRKGVSVELHYDVTDFPDSEGGRATKMETARFMEDIAHGELYNYNFSVLSDGNQGLSLLLHMIRHMFGGGIGLRQLCDWAVYIASIDPEVFENKTLCILERCGLLRYAKAATRACVKYLGMPDRNLSWCADVTDEESYGFVDNIFHGGNMGSANKDGVGGLLTDSDAMGSKQNAILAMFTKLTKIAYHHFPFLKKCKILLPVFWVFLPIRYAVRALFGLRPKKSVTKVMAAANRQRNLYEMLRPFEKKK